jgi:transcriptional regulator with XRE-family HTH domain
MTTSVSASGRTDIKSRRKRLGLSQRDLAAVARCSPSSIRLYESGYTPELSPTLDRITRLLNELTMPEARSER